MLASLRVAAGTGPAHLGYTHYQAAQMVTVGKRATLWMNELLSDLEEVEYRLDHLKLRGLQGHHRHPGQLF